MNLFDLCVYKNLNKGSGGDVDVSSLVATENKTYNAGEGKAYNPVVVNVPTPSPSLQSLTASHNGYFVPSSGYDGFSEVNVEVATPLETLSATENGTYTPSSGYEGFSEVTVDVPLPNNAYLLESQKDDVVTIQHGAEFDMPKLIASIEPQQDLHGYDSPWVGGAGKNKFDSDTVLSAFTKNNNKYVGMPSYVADNYVISGGFKTNTRYTLSYKAYNNTSTSSNFRFSFSYTDETEEIIGGFVDTTTEKVIVGTSAENKTISKIKRNYGNGVELTLYDIQLEEGSTATSFAPYSNICPISGWDEVNVTVADATTSPTVEEVYTIDLDGTRYGGKLDVVNGELVVTDGYIASYNGETLPSTWISDRDVYAEGTTPTTGAEVCYKLATPQTYQLTPTQVQSLLGVNNIFADTGEVDVQIWTKEVTS